VLIELKAPEALRIAAHEHFAPADGTLPEAQPGPGEALRQREDS